MARVTRWGSGGGDGSGRFAKIGTFGVGKAGSFAKVGFAKMPWRHLQAGDPHIHYAIMTGWVFPKQPLRGPQGILPHIHFGEKPFARGSLRARCSVRTRRCQSLAGCSVRAVRQGRNDRCGHQMSEGCLMARGLRAGTHLRCYPSYAFGAGSSRSRATGGYAVRSPLAIRHKAVLCLYSIVFT